MQPDNPDQNQKDRLDFIMQTELEKPKSTSAKLRSKSGILLGAIILIVISIFGIFFAASNSKAKSEQNQRLISIAQTQTEIIRISSLAQSQATDDNSKAKADEITNKISSSLEDIKALLAKNGANIDETNFAGKKNSETDSKLVESLQNKEFNDTFSSLMEENLIDYQQLVLDAQQTANEDDKPVLEKLYNQVNEILGIEDQG